MEARLALVDDEITVCRLLQYASGWGGQGGRPGPDHPLEEDARAGVHEK